MKNSIHIFWVFWSLQKIKSIFLALWGCLQTIKSMCFDLFLPWMRNSFPPPGLQVSTRKKVPPPISFSAQQNPYFWNLVKIILSSNIVYIFWWKIIENALKITKNFLGGSAPQTPHTYQLNFRSQTSCFLFCPRFLKIQEKLTHVFSVFWACKKQNASF